jgi:hypothetical protein
MSKGRKRKLRKRYRHGQPIRHATTIDRGTPEMQSMRQAITRDQRLSPDYPLSILLGHGLISEVQHDAGMRFARNAWAVFGKPFGRALDYGEGRGAAPTAAEELILRAAYDAGLAALAELGAAALIVDLAVHLHRGWLVDAIVKGERRYRRHAVQLEKIRVALDALAGLQVRGPTREEREAAEREVA